MTTRARAEPDVSGVLLKVHRILQAFDLDHPALGLSELARLTKLPKSSVHRVATEMAELGLLERDGSRYRLGVELVELGQRVPRARILRDAALPFMEDLYVESRETVHLSIPWGTSVRYVDRIAGHQQVGGPGPGGGNRTPMHATASGLVMLAFGDPAWLDELIAAGLQRVGPRTITVPAVLRTALREVAADGHAIEHESTRAGYCSVAAPILVGRELIGALSLTGPQARFDPERWAPALRASARGVARRLA
jgi:DNA-binding IclR family transcriptional regulator